MHNLSICGKDEVPSVGRYFDDIVDCTPEGPTHRHVSKTLHLPPTGSNSHKWAEADLDAIVEVVEGCMENGRRVLINCNRGVSRSTCAAAAILLHLGEAGTVEEALDMCRNPERDPVRTAVKSLEEWWTKRLQLNLWAGSK